MIHWLSPMNNDAVVGTEVVRSEPASEPTPLLQWLAIAVGLFVALCFDIRLIIQLYARGPDSDFGIIYKTGSDFLRGEPMYRPNFTNLNPPHVQVLLAPLALLTLDAALTVWLLLGFICVAAGVRIIAGELGGFPTVRDRLLALLWLLSFAGFSWVLFSGHLSFLLFLGMTLGWRAARHGHWQRAAVYLGIVIATKFFWALLLPYVFLRAPWRATALLLATMGLLFGAGVAAAGIENWLGWQDNLSKIQWTWSHLNASVYSFLTRTFDAGNGIGEPMVALPPTLIRAMWLGLAVPMTLVTLGLAVRDRSPLAVDRAFALLLVGALLVSPLGWVYYALIPLGPVCLVAAQCWSQGPKARDSRILLIAALVGFLYPLQYIVAFFTSQWRSPLVTLVAGSLSFWSLFLLWLALVLDAWRPTTSEPGSA
jgi:hypothetical protein